MTGPTDPVPTCPAWVADDLLWHLAEVQHFWSAIVGDRMPDPNSYVAPERVVGREALRQFFETAHGRLIDALADAADEETAWSWFAPDQTVGFTRRRQAHEALIHRIDAETSAGCSSPVDVELAADGVDEALTIMFGHPPGWATVDDTGPVGTVRATDAERSWLVRVDSFSGTSPDTGTTYDRAPVLAVVESVEEGAVSFEISGGAADLDRWFWRRPIAGAVERTGDVAGIEAVVAAGLE